MGTRRAQSRPPVRPAPSSSSNDTSLVGPGHLDCKTLVSTNSLSNWFTFAFIRFSVALCHHRQTQGPTTHDPRSDSHR